MKEVKKGNKVPYHGYLLNISEYEKYLQAQKLLPELITYFENTNETYTNRKQLH